MYFEAILFLAGAVLFFLAVLFFVFLWQDRAALTRRHEELETEMGALKEQRVDLDIWEHELQVWALGLEHQQLAIAKAEEELKMLTATKQSPDAASASLTAAEPAGDNGAGRVPDTPASDQAPADLATKNLKLGAKSTKLQA